MHHITFGGNNATYPVALLFKPTALNKVAIERYYIDPLRQFGIAAEDVIAFTLDVVGKKVTAPVAKAYLEHLLPALNQLGSKYLYVTDGEYFKVLTKSRKAEPNMGYALPCAITGFEHMTVVLGLNYQQLIYNPAIQEKLDQTIAALASSITGGYIAPGTGIIQQAVYPESSQDIRETLEKLLEYPELTCDIETFSLRFWLAGIATISFAIDENNGVAFPVDYVADINGNFSKRIDNKPIKKMLKDFFTRYKGKIIWHNGGYDVKVILYELWMKPV